MKIIAMICIGISLIVSCHINGNTHSSKNESKALNTDSLKCNIDVVVRLSKTMENPDKVAILNFLFTFDETCNSNVEYSEFSNEVLFQVVQKHPNQVLELLSNKRVKTQIILKELKSPLSDAYGAADLSGFIEKVEDIQNHKKE